jgi:hypothetical protein
LIAPEHVAALDAALREICERHDYHVFDSALGESLI